MQKLSSLFNICEKASQVFIVIPIILLLGFFATDTALSVWELLYTLWPFVFIFLAASAGVPFLFYRITGKRSSLTAKLVTVTAMLFCIVLLAGFNLQGVFLRISSAANCVLIAFACLSVGRNFFDLLKVNFTKPSERLILSALAGFGIFSLTIMLSGVLYKTGRSVTWAIILIFVLAGAFSIKEQVKDFRELLDNWHRNAELKEIMLLLCLALTVLITLPMSFVPPLDYDVTEYHAELPRSYLYQEKIEFSEHNIFSGMPQNMEMLTLASMSLNKESKWFTAKLLHWLFLPLLIAMVFLTAKKMGAGKYSVTGIMLLLSSPLTLFLSAKLYVETGMCSFGLAALYCCLSAEGGDNKRLYLLSGIFAGLSAGVKYPALLFFCMPVMLIICLDNWKKGSALKSAAVFIAGILFVFTPWLAKNVLQTGNPVFPIFNSLFSVTGWTDILNQRFHDAHRASDFSSSAVFSYLKILFFKGRQLFPTPFIFILLSVPGMFSHEKEIRRHFRYLFGWVMLIVMLWFFLTHRLDRFLQPAFVIASLGGAVALADLKNRYLKMFFIFASILVFLFSITIAGWSLYLKDKGYSSVALHGKSAELILKNDPSYKAAEILKTFPPQSKILALGDAAHFYYPHNVKMAVVFDHHPLFTALEKSESAEQLAAFLKKDSYTHLYISWPELARLHATYYKAYELDAGKQKILRLFLSKNVRKITPLVSLWPEWQGETALLPDFFKEDFAAYRRVFGVKSEKIFASSSYAAARPWLGIYGHSQDLGRSQGQLLNLFKSYNTLLSPTRKGGPPPLCRAPYECLQF
ncbi:MAG: ArnT family glycosyltransferase [Planctomycetota bacterium]|jgi:hypothetical protein